MTSIKITRLFCVWVILLTFANGVTADSTRTAIASAHPLATEAGFEILQQGGNAFDAAVAVSAALAVVEPAGSGLGGGGFWLLHRAEDSFSVMLDGREKAPLKATAHMYLDEKGQFNKNLSKNGPLAAGIPGVPAALVHLSEHYGRLPLKTSLQPAIRYARQGFAIGERHRRLLNFRKNILTQFPASANVFLQNNEVPDAGSLLIQADLAATLELIAEQGKNGFYAGRIAEKLVSEVQKAGGIWTLDDLSQYQVVERKPVTIQYHDLTVTSAALPSSGGIVLAEALNILSAYPLHQLNSVERHHLIIEALRRAYRDRALYLGDPDFIDVPVDLLMNPSYAAGLRTTIRNDGVLPSRLMAGDWTTDEEGTDTTHFSIIDQDGNRVAATLSINYPFGSGFVPEGTGVLLNDEMDDFSSKAGEMNGYGLIGSQANAIAPGKRMLSSMTPTFVETRTRIGVLGTPGGSRIISMVLLGILNLAEGGHPNDWVAVPRFHHQFIPDTVVFEPGGLTEKDQQGLKDLGHALQEHRYRYGNMQAVELNKLSGELSGASDSRGEGLAQVR